MTLTPVALYKHFDGEEGYTCYRAYACDLFGALNWAHSCEKDEFDDRIQTCYGVYKGLYLMGVSAKEIYRCYLKNKLDELIHTKYSFNQSGYYREFCEKNIVIGNTFLTVDDGDNQDNEDDNEPYIYTNISPSYHLEDGHGNTVFERTDEFDTCAKNKIAAYKNQDRNKNRNFNNEEYCDIDTIIRLIEKQDSKCYVCGDNVIFDDHKASCLYQFTLDRADETLPHNKNNVLLSCYYCNCFGFTGDDNNVCKHKMCGRGCHKTKRSITRTRNNISSTEINKLLLK
tara:strand:- start:437 stop:1291 length:855 start_codon:yes stop_codon:yes gene_type:complete